MLYKTQGDGTLGAPIATAVTNAERLAAGDVNGDGKADLVVGAPNAVSLLRGNGDGTFQGPLTSSIAARSAESVAIADVDRDGHMDVVVGSATDESVTVLFDLGGGGTSGNATFISGDLTEQAVPADVDGDGSVDIVATSTSGVAAFLGGFGGNARSFGAPFESAFAATFNGTASSLAVGDFNGDGAPDLAVAGSGNKTAIYLRQNGVLTHSGDLTTGQTGGGTVVTSGDLNGDGFDDLVVIEQTFAGTGIALRFAGSGGGFGSEIFDGAAGAPVALFDLDGDGDLDIVDNGSVLINTGFGFFSNHGGLSLGNAGVAGADFDGDGDLDLVTATSFAAPAVNTLRVLANDGTGAFTNAAIQPPLPAGAIPTSLAAGDFDGDGHADFAVADINGVVDVYFGTGGGAFAPVNVVPAGALGSSLRNLVAVDENGDGRPDLVVTDFNRGSISVLLSTANRTFALRRFVAAKNPFAIAASRVGTTPEILVSENAQRVLEIENVGCRP